VYKTSSLFDKQNVLLNQVSWQNIYDVKTFMNDSNNINDKFVKTLMLNMLSNEIDSSEVTNMPHRSVTPRQLLNGLIRKNRKNTRQQTTLKIDDQTQFLHSLLFKDNLLTNNDLNNTQNNVLVATYDNVVDQTTNITCDIVIHTNKINLQEEGSNLLVKFEVVNDKKIIIDDEIQQLNINEHIKNYKVPLTAPTAHVVKSYNLSRNILEISNFDNKTKGITIFQKDVQQSKIGGQYLFFGKFDVKNNIPVRVPINSFTHKYVVYRIIPTGDNQVIGYDFTNIVVKPTRSTVPKNLTLISKLIETGIQIEVRDLPFDVVSVLLLAKNRTSFEQTYRQISLQHISDIVRQQNLIIFTDTSPQINCVYEYKIRCFLKNGLTYDMGCVLVEFFKKQSAINTVISNLNVTNNGINQVNVQFQFDSELLDNNFDILHTLLKNRDIDNLFQDSLLKERELFKKLLAHNIQRINLTTGERENFGTLVGNVFDDKKERTKNNVKQLTVEHAYRYEVYPMFRSIDSLFEASTKIVIDPVSKKQYVSQPSKFLHPIALNYGLLLTTQGKEVLYSHDEMTHGIIGNVENIDVMFNSSTPNITSFIATRINYEFINLTWEVPEGLRFRLIDYFIIMKDVFGVRTIIGKMHSQSKKSSFMHKLTHDDVGQFKYILVPVYNNYTLGTMLESNTVEVLDDIN
jgi:hypothetical protein